MATTRRNCTTGRTINECARFICTQNNLQSGYNGHSAQVYGKGVLEGPEIPTCVGLPSRKYLPVSVQVERRPATAVSYVTRRMATGAPARAPADAISSATWQTDTGAPARAPASQGHLMDTPARAPADQQPSHLPRGRRLLARALAMCIVYTILGESR